MPEQRPAARAVLKDAEQAGDQELVDFFRKAQHESKKGAEQAKQLLASRVGKS